MGKNRLQNRFNSFLFATLLIVVILLWGQFFYSRPSPNLNLYFLDVGQGDAIYIRTPTGEDALIDGGPDDSILQKLGEVMSPTDHEINLVILSHPHADHLKGLLEVLSRYKVDEILQTDVEYDSVTFLTWQKMIGEKQIANHLARAGVERSLGEAKILILPILLFNFKYISLVAPLANVLVLSLIPLTMLLGFVGLVLAFIWIPAGQFFAFIPWIFLHWIVWVAQKLSALPWSALQIEKWNGWLIVGYYIVLAGMLFFLQYKKRPPSP